MDILCHLEASKYIRILGYASIQYSILGRNLELTEYLCFVLYAHPMNMYVKPWYLPYLSFSLASSKLSV